MADPYLDIAAIAQDEYMRQRLQACVTQEAYQGHIPLSVNDAPSWVTANSYVWASSPGWGAKWASALAADNPEPGKDPAVITDGDILATVQAIIPSLAEREQAAAEAPADEREQSTADQAQAENAAAS